MYNYITILLVFVFSGKSVYEFDEGIRSYEFSVIIILVM